MVVISEGRKKCKKTAKLADVFVRWEGATYSSKTFLLQFFVVVFMFIHYHTTFWSKFSLICSWFLGFLWVSLSLTLPCNYKISLLYFYKHLIAKPKNEDTTQFSFDFTRDKRSYKVWYLRWTSIFVFVNSHGMTYRNSLNVLVWKFCGKTQFPQSFGRLTRNSAETVPFHKVFTPWNKVRFPQSHHTMKQGEISTKSSHHETR